MNLSAEQIGPWIDGRAWVVLDGGIVSIGGVREYDNGQFESLPQSRTVFPPAVFTEHDRECPECGGTSGPDWNVPVCESCAGSGRDTFDVTVPCRQTWVRADETCPDPGCDNGTVTKRMSIVEGTVLPIIEVPNTGYPSSAPTRFACVSPNGTLRVVDKQMHLDTRNGPAPSAARPGMWAAQLQEQP